MLVYKNRLIKKDEFQAVFLKGRYYSNKNIAIKALNQGTDNTRVGFSVGLKYSKKAVDRNRIKRQLRAVFCDEIPRIKKGYDIVVMIRNKDGGEFKKEELVRMVRVVLNEAGLIT